MNVNAFQVGDLGRLTDDVDFEDQPVRLEQYPHALFLNPAHHPVSESAGIALHRTATTLFESHGRIDGQQFLEIIAGCRSQLGHAVGNTWSFLHLKHYFAARLARLATGAGVLPKYFD